MLWKQFTLKKAGRANQTDSELIPEPDVNKVQMTLDLNEGRSNGLVATCQPVLVLQGHHDPSQADGADIPCIKHCARTRIWLG